MISRSASPQSERTLDDVWRWYELAMRPDEVKARLDDYRASLIYLVSLDLITVGEGRLRQNVARRVKERKKDILSKEYKKLKKQFKDRVELDALLDALKVAYSTETRTIGAFNGLLIYRHWLAYGRYWQIKLGRGYTAEQIFEICNKLLHITALQ